MNQIYLPTIPILLAGYLIQYNYNIYYILNARVVCILNSYIYVIMSIKCIM